MVKLIAPIACGALASIGTHHYLSFNPHLPATAYVYHGMSVSWPVAAFALVGVVMFGLLGKH